ncbi:hypothetical protein Naga_101275g2 [Nannochloropsis gaditana]|uniref:Uncharacterized protein n=1 Tax=Nannochloropsis gaditana TaxID=72520 RepID=W7TU21_9STRA|nr:hypothetical protein Naga_101275g2 [Nannochloropsis gaditana]
MPPILLEDAAIDALFTEVEACAREDDGEVHPLPVRLLQDSVSGEMVALPPAIAQAGDESYFFERIAATTTPFGLPVPGARELLMERYLEIEALLDDMVRDGRST